MRIFSILVLGALLAQSPILAFADRAKASKLRDVREPKKEMGEKGQEGLGANLRAGYGTPPKKPQE